MTTLQDEVRFRPPLDSDGALVHDLISRCSPLDSNSMYCNLLQCAHFSDTCVAALSQNQMLGFVSGYCIPGRPDCLFIWQVAVDSKARGMGLASKMLRHILERPHCSRIAYLETTITESNQASWALFNSLAKKLDAPVNTSVMFDKNKHFSDLHDTEMLVRIGPFNQFDLNVLTEKKG